MKWTLTIAALMTLTAGITLGALGRWEVLVICFFATALLLLCANLDQIAEISASSDGLRAKTRELVRQTEGAISELQMLAAQLAALGLSLIKRQGRLGGYSVPEEQRLKSDTLAVVARLGVRNEEIQSAMSEWHAVEEFDYVQSILGNSQIPRPISDHELAKEWKDLRNFSFGSAPDPSVLREFLKKHRLLDDDREALIQDYEFYRCNREHRRMHIWEKHSDWPPLVRSNT
ncbi:hypothetical protein WHX56_15200 [Achromobacter veterisilvae]|uniref:Uncharacterized protein n=1 Tax=Achromobacter veterisilvae TaxID=2069367 RepID=A0ABZ2S775_9BURK